MPRFIPIETLLDSIVTFGTSELYRRSWKLNEYGEPLFFWQVEKPPNTGQKKVIVYTLSNLWLVNQCSKHVAHK